jgi:hypothetical protein
MIDFGLLMLALFIADISLMVALFIEEFIGLKVLTVYLYHRIILGEKMVIEDKKEYVRNEILYDRFTGDEVKVKAEYIPIIEHVKEEEEG